MDIKMDMDLALNPSGPIGCNIFLTNNFNSFGNLMKYFGKTPKNSTILGLEIS